MVVWGTTKATCEQAFKIAWPCQPFSDLFLECRFAKEAAPEMKHSKYVECV